MDYIEGYKQGIKDSIALLETCKKSMEKMLEELDKRLGNEHN